MGDSALSTATVIGFTIAGSALGGPFGAMIGAGLGAYVAGELFGEDIEVSRGRIADLKVSSSEYGGPITHIWGCSRVGGQAYFSSDLIEKVQTETNTPGKGGQTVVSRTFAYAIDIGYKLALSPAHFPIVSMPRGWMNGKLVWDFSNETGPVFSAKYVGEAGGPFNSGVIRLRFGDEDQIVDPTYEVYGGVGTTPTDRGYGTVILEDFPLEDFGNSPPQLNVLVCTATTGLFPVASMPEWTVNTGSILFAPDGRTLFEIGGNTTQPGLVNSDTREFIIAPGDITLEPLVGTGNNNGTNPRGFHDIDQFGRGLSHSANLSGVMTPFLHDIRTYSVIARGENGSTGIVQSGSQWRFFGLNDERIFTYGNSGNTYSIHISGTPFPVIEGEDGATFTGGLIVHVVTGAWDEQLPAISNDPFFAMDEQTGHLWTTHDDGADLILVHWSLDFIELERFAIVAHQADKMGYDNVSHSFFFGEVGPGNLWRWSIDDEALFATELTGLSIDDFSAPFASIHEGKIYLEGGGTLNQFDIPTMTQGNSYELDGGSKWNLPGSIDAPLYDAFLHAVIISDGTNNPVYWAFLDRETPGMTTLEAILDNEVLISGYEGGSADSDATDHSTVNVLGWAAGGQTKVVGESQAQADLWKFGHVESGHKITFPARGRATTFALADDDLGVKPFGQPPIPKLLISRLDQAELPVQSEMKFEDPDLDWQEGFQRAHLAPEVVPGTDKTESRSFRVTMTNEEALRREFLHLTQQYGDQQRYQLATFHKSMAIDPGDTGTITSDGIIHLVMVEDTTLGANLIYEITAVGFAIPTLSEADAILTQIHSQNTDLMAQTPDGFIPQIIDQFNISDLEMIDNVFLDDIVDQGNELLETQMTVQRRISGGNWTGANIQRAPDNLTFSDWHFYKAEFEGEIGRTGTALGSVRDFEVIDDVSTVDVTFRSDLVLASITDVALFNGENVFLVGDELLQAGTITDNGNGDWTLSHFLRARRGTEWAFGNFRWQFLTPDHTQWERVLFLGTKAALNKAMFKATALTDINVSYDWRANSLGSVPTVGASRKFTNTGNSLRPLAPIPISGVKNGADWDITLTRRNRTGGALRDFGEVPQTDPSVWEVDVYDDPNNSSPVSNNVLRTITGTATVNGTVANADGTVVYDETDMISDFGQSPLSKHMPLYRLMLAAYQVNSATVGRGFPGTAIVEDFPVPVPSDPDFSNVSLLLHCQTLTPPDKSSNALTMTYGLGYTLTTGDYLDGVGQYAQSVLTCTDISSSEIRIAAADYGSVFDFGSGDYTVEMWFAQTQGSHNGAIFGAYKRANPNREGWTFEFNSGGINGEIHFDYIQGVDSPSGISVDIPDTSTAMMHWAAVKDGTTLSLYRNGARIAEQTGITHTIVAPSLQDFVIFETSENPDGHLEGNIEAIRVTKGVARISGATYSPPPHRFANN